MASRTPLQPVDPLVLRFGNNALNINNNNTVTPSRPSTRGGAALTPPTTTRAARRKRITVRNDTGTDLELDRIELEASRAAGFQIEQRPAMPMRFAQGDEARFVVSMSPEARVGADCIMTVFARSPGQQTEAQPLQVFRLENTPSPRRAGGRSLRVQMDQFTPPMSAEARRQTRSRMATPPTTDAGRHSHTLFSAPLESPVALADDPARRALSNLSSRVHRVASLLNAAGALPQTPQSPEDRRAAVRENLDPRDGPNDLMLYEIRQLARRQESLEATMNDLSQRVGSIESRLQDVHTPRPEMRAGRPVLAEIGGAGNGTLLGGMNDTLEQMRTDEPFTVFEDDDNLDNGALPAQPTVAAWTLQLSRPYSPTLERLGNELNDVDR